MNAGDLRHNIIFQRQDNIQDPVTGENKVTWVNIAKKSWAKIEPLSVRAFIAAQSNQSKITAIITIRHRADIGPHMRISHGDKIYTIEGILPDKKSGREYLTISVSEGVKK